MAEKIYKVYLGVGHGGSDPGGVANGFKEKDVNLEVALACRDYLVKNGVVVKISRTTDKEVWLEKRIQEANEFGADLAADIHHNMGKGDGGEVYHTKYLGKGKTLANNILKEMGKIGQNSRGAKIKLNDKRYDYFGFVRLILCPSVLVECAFLDNKEDVKIVDTKAERKAMGEAIAKGILKTLGVKTKKAKKYTGVFPKLPNRGYLKQGDSGVDVVRWQKFLAWYGFKIDVDGIFGIKTHNATREFQKQTGFSKALIDGLVGKQTVAKAKKIKK